MVVGDLSSVSGPFIIERTLVSLLCVGAIYLKQKQRKHRSLWVHNILRTQRLHGEYHRLVQELHLDDGWFQRYFRLDKSQFDDLLTKVGPLIHRIDTN